MGTIEKQHIRHIEPAGRNGMGVGGAIVGIVVLGLALAVAWTLFTSVLGLLWLGFKIALVLAIIAVALVLVGMFRTHVLRR